MSFNRLDENGLEKDCGWWEWVTFWKPEHKYFTNVKFKVACWRIVMDFVLENFLSAVIYRVVMSCKTQVASSSFQHQDTVLDVQLARMLFINGSLTSFVAVVLTGLSEGFLCFTWGKPMRKSVFLELSGRLRLILAVSSLLCGKASPNTKKFCMH